MSELNMDNREEERFKAVLSVIKGSPGNGFTNFALADKPRDEPTEPMVVAALFHADAIGNRERLDYRAYQLERDYDDSELRPKIRQLVLPKRVREMQPADDASIRQQAEISLKHLGLPYVVLMIGRVISGEKEVVYIYHAPGLSTETALREIQDAVISRVSKLN